MTEHTWKIEKNLCRCCHSEGAFTNLAEPCLNLGEEEIFSQMLLESFDVNVAPVTGPLCEVTYTICDGCIQRLRDACYFKRQVVKCEKRFHDLYSKNVIKFDSCYEVKVEAPDSDDEDDMKLEMFEDEDDFAVKSDDDEKKLEVQIEVEEVTPKPKRKVAPKRKAKNTKVISKLRKKLEAPGKAKDKTEEDAEESAEAEAAKQRKEKKGNPLVDEYVTVRHTDQKYTCKACEVSYKRISDLRYHIIRSHLKQKFIKCQHCPETFMYHSQRKGHTLLKHSEQAPDKFVCAHCNREFKRKNTLAEHMMDVHIEKKCRQCDGRFVRKKYLFHLNEKHGAAMPTCGVCGLRTLMQSTLVRHQRNVHLNEKKKRCTVCSKMFHTQSNLQDHMITHEQRRVFKCGVCAKTFTRKECLKAHSRIHTSERPFACKVCNAAFVQRAGLRFHVRSHHPGTI